MFGYTHASPLFIARFFRMQGDMQRLAASGPKFCRIRMTSTCSLAGRFQRSHGQECGNFGINLLCVYPAVNQHSYGKWTIAMDHLNLPIKIVIFRSYVSLPEGTCFQVWRMGSDGVAQNFHFPKKISGLHAAARY
jgi:hypothetical protein